MPKISNLNAGELKNLISEAEKLLRQRGKLDVVIRDIEKVLARHKLKKAEIAEVLKLMQESGGPRRAAGAAPNKRVTSGGLLSLGPTHSGGSGGRREARVATRCQLLSGLASRARPPSSDIPRIRI